MPDLARPAFFWLRDAFRRKTRIAKLTESSGVENMRMVNQGSSQGSVKNANGDSGGQRQPSNGYNEA